MALSPHVGQMLAAVIVISLLVLLIPTLQLLSLGLVTPVAAQVNRVGQAICGTGLGQLVGVTLAAISLYLIVKGVFRGAIAFDKMGASRSETQYQGKRQLVGAGKTAAGAFIPAVFGAMLELVGVRTVSCIDFTTGLMGGSVILPL